MTAPPPGGGASNGHPLPLTLMLLTFTTGLVDAVSFLGLGHVFTANMTGNIVFIGFSMAGAEGVSAPRSLVAIAAFLVGAAIGGRLAVAMKERSHRSWLSFAATLEAIFLVAGALCALSFDVPAEAPLWSLYGIIVATALAMGLRNATVVRIADPDLKTTVFTLTLTAIAADSSLAGGTNPRLGRRITSVFALLAGAAAGAWTLRTLGPAVALFGMAIIVVAGTALYVTHPAAAATIGWGKRR